MSGGHWSYMADTIEEWGNNVANVMKVVAEVEHTLDWGLSADTCLACARKRVPLAFEALFNDRLGADGAMVAIAILRDAKQNECDKCKRTRRVYLDREGKG